MNNWSKNKRKTQKNLGQEHINSKGKIVKKKMVKDGCSIEKCKLKCHLHINRENREDLFRNYWRMGDINMQRQFITRAVDKIATNRSYTKGNSRRKNTFVYHFLFHDTNAKVSCLFLLLSL